MVNFSQDNFIVPHLSLMQSKINKIKHYLFEYKKRILRDLNSLILFNIYFVTKFSEYIVVIQICSHGF